VSARILSGPFTAVLFYPLFFFPTFFLAGCCCGFCGIGCRCFGSLAISDLARSWPTTRPPLHRRLGRAGSHPNAKKAAVLSRPSVSSPAKPVIFPRSRKIGHAATAIAPSRYPEPKGTVESDDAPAAVVFAFKETTGAVRGHSRRLKRHIPTTALSLTPQLTPYSHRSLSCDTAFRWAR
jgi:hypothetical protein